MKEMNFNTEKMFPLIMKMALPSIAAQFVNMLYSIVDRIYIGHIPDIGTNALAGVGICNSIIILVSAFAQFTGGGGAPLASIELGRGKPEKAEKMMNNGIFLIICSSIGLMLVIYFIMTPLLKAIGASSSTLPYAHSYLSIYLAGTVFVLLTIGLNPFVNLQGHPYVAMGTVLIGAILNIALDPVFIFTLHMEVAGAAVATVLSQAVSALWIIHFLVSPKAMLHIRIKEMRPEKSILKKILALGISPFVMSSTESVIGFVMNRQLSQYGDIYVSTLTIMQSCMQIYSVPLNGFSQGASPVISFNYGRSNVERVKQGFHVVFWTMTIFNFIMTTWEILQPSLFGSIFTDDPALLAHVTKIMPLFLAGMTIFGMQRACQTMFIALNQPKISLFIALLRKIILLVPLALILPHFLGVIGVYSAEAIADGMAAVCCIILFLYRFSHILKAME